MIFTVCIPAVCTTDFTDNYCPSYQLMCDNGDCYYESDKCDDYNDCGDNSDEEGCGMSNEMRVILLLERGKINSRYVYIISTLCTFHDSTCM